jgi:hypothetical protein
MGIAEREHTVKNVAFTNMASVVVLRDAIAALLDRSLSGTEGLARRQQMV